MNMEMPIIRPRLHFEQEFGTHRNWWVRDARLTGNPLSILLYLLSHDQNHRITQTEAQAVLGLGESAWRTAKHKLMEAGFLIEIRDRYTHGQRKGQKRFRLVLQDPQPDTFIDVADAIIDADEHPEIVEMITGESHSRKSRVGQKATLENQDWVGKPQVRASRENQDWVGATLENQESLIGRENQVRLGNGLLNNQTNQPNQRASTESDAINAELEQLLPGLGLTFEVIASALNGRVDLETIDVVAAVRDTLLKSKSPVSRPADYVASSIAKNPHKWVVGQKLPGTYQPRQTAAPQTISAVQESARQREECEAGRHDWGPTSWAEHDRAWCVRGNCNTPRRSVDKAFARFQDKHDASGVNV